MRIAVKKIADITFRIFDNCIFFFYFWGLFCYLKIEESPNGLAIGCEDTVGNNGDGEIGRDAKPHCEEWLRRLGFT